MKKIKKFFNYLWVNFKKMTKENFNKSDTGKILKSQLEWIDQEDKDAIKHKVLKLKAKK